MNLAAPTGKKKRKPSHRPCRKKKSEISHNPGKEGGWLEPERKFSDPSRDGKFEEREKLADWGGTFAGGGPDSFVRMGGGPGKKRPVSSRGEMCRG